MYASADPLELRVALEHTRTQFLKKLRGRSDVYDGVRERAARLARATGASDTIMALIEAVLIEQHLQTADTLDREHKRDLAAVKRSEHQRIRWAVDKALDNTQPPEPGSVP